MFTGKRIGRLAVWCSLLLGSAAHAEASMWNLTEGVTPISREVYHLHMMMFWVCVAIAVVVFGVMFYSLFAFRRSKHPVPATFHESTMIEVLWTIAPFIILIAMAIPAAGTLIKMYDTRNADMTVKITGVQWRWQYDYLESGISFVSSLSADSNAARQLHSGIDPTTVPNYLLSVDHNLVLPVGKKVRFLITSDDVIHGWWVPDLAVKRDAIPGFVNEVWAKIDTPGIYRGQCTVLCGRDHGFMPIVVEALPQDQYDAWVKAQTAGKTAESAMAAPVETPAAAPEATATPAASMPVAAAPAAATAVAARSESAAPAVTSASKADLMTAGAKVYAGNCQACHQADGHGMAPTFPSLAGSKVATGPVSAHILQVLKGKNMMPPFATSLSDEQIAAVVTYERNSFGNSVGDTAQASQVAALRK